MHDLFPPADESARQALGPQSVLLRGFALPFGDALVEAIEAIERDAPFRRMVTPGGYTMSAAQTNCGALGWTSDRRGYRYAAVDPGSGRPWPPLPEAFLRLAREAADAAGFAAFVPDACLLNRYVRGAKLSLHQDKDERDFDAPIVSVSLGLPATFLFGGARRADKVLRVPLAHGDVVCWGGVDRLRYHGIAVLKAGMHPLLGEQRINLTFRKAG